MIILVLTHVRIYFGTTPFLFITDLDMIRDVTMKQFDKFVDHMVSLLFVPVHSKHGRNTLGQTVMYPQNCLLLLFLFSYHPYIHYYEQTNKVQQLVNTNIDLQTVCLNEFLLCSACIYSTHVCL